MEAANAGGGNSAFPGMVPGAWLPLTLSLFSMNDGFRRFSILLFVFLLAFLAVFVLRRLQGGETLSDLWPWNQGEEERFKPEEFTLPDDPPLDIDDVEMLVRLNKEYAKLSEAVVPSVVSIDTAGVKKERLRDVLGRVWERQREVSGSGSGVIVTKEGHVVTNNHVIEDQGRIRITLHSGKTYPAHLIGKDRILDIAVLRIDAPDVEFEPLAFGDSDLVQTGQLAFAIGNPFGLGETITQGIISAKERSISDTQRDLFQTDAAINPGNSGGPLVNLFGEIIAINVAIYSPDSQNRGFHGVGFSIPSNDVKEIFEQILERGRPIRGYLGIKAHDINPRIRQVLNYEGAKGVVVLEVVTQSPAEKAGLQEGDVIVEYDGGDVLSREYLFNRSQRTKVGKKVKIGVWRAGEKLELEATVVDADEALGNARVEPESRSASDQEIVQAIGLKVRDYEMIDRIRGAQGVWIIGVAPGSLAEQNKLQKYDVILSINGVGITSSGQFYADLLASAAVQKTTLIGQRGARPFKVTFPPVPRSNGEQR